MDDSTTPPSAPSPAAAPAAPSSPSTPPASSPAPAPAAPPTTPVQAAPTPAAPEIVTENVALGAHTVERKGIRVRVRAIRAGFDGIVKRTEGEVFDFILKEGEKLGSWMVEHKPAKPAAPPQE